MVSSYSTTLKMTKNGNLRNLRIVHCQMLYSWQITIRHAVPPNELLILRSNTHVHTCHCVCCPFQFLYDNKLISFRNSSIHKKLIAKLLLVVSPLCANSNHRCVVRCSYYSSLNISNICLIAGLTDNAVMKTSGIKQMHNASDCDSVNLKS